MTEIQEFDVKQSIAESTKLVREMFDYTVTKRQFDLIYAIISLVKPTDNEFMEYRIPYKAIGKIFNPANPDCQITYKDIEKAITGIMKSCFRIKRDENIEKYYHWVEDAENHKDEKYIIFKLSKEVQQFYLRLNEDNYTVYVLKDILDLSTLFQANLFRWLSCNAGFKNNINISIENAVWAFNGKDIQTKHLISKIDAALKVINEKTNIEASYEKVKTGKTITSLNFKINNKYTKPQKIKTAAQMQRDAKQGKKLWQENMEMKKQIKELECKINALENPMSEEERKEKKEALLESMKRKNK